MSETTNAPLALPQTHSIPKSELSNLRDGMVESTLTQALPVTDFAFGGIVLVMVVMVHAFGVRLITGSALKRSPAIRARGVLWGADLAFSMMVMALLALHLLEVMLWTAALFLADIVPDWSKAAYFAANCYTALGEPFSLQRAWRIVPPIIAISGIFTFAWTGSVLVNFVARYNEMRADILARRNPSEHKPSP